MRKFLGVLMVLGLFLTVAGAYASDPFNVYNFSIDNSLSSIRFDVWIKKGTAVMGSDFNEVKATGTISQVLWQSGTNHDVFSQAQITDMNFSSMTNPTVSPSWYYNFMSYASMDATVTDLNIKDLKDYQNPAKTPQSYNHPSGSVDTAGNFSLTNFGLNNQGSMAYQIYKDFNPNPIASDTLTLGSLSPQFSTLGGTVTKTGNTVNLVADLAFGGTKDLSSYGSSLSGYSMVYQFSMHAVSQSAFQDVLAGDASCDHAVDVSDLGILAANYGRSGATWTEGDFSGDGIVDVSDLGILAANYGRSGGSSPGFVPEPLTLLFLGLGIAGLAKRK